MASLARYVSKRCACLRIMSQPVPAQLLTLVRCYLQYSLQVAATSALMRVRAQPESPTKSAAHFDADVTQSHDLRRCSFSCRRAMGWSSTTERWRTRLRQRTARRCSAVPSSSSTGTSLRCAVGDECTVRLDYCDLTLKQHSISGSMAATFEGQERLPLSTVHGK